MPASCAMADTDAPGTRLRSTSARFMTSECRRRVSGRLVTRISMCASIGLRAHIQACVRHLIVLSTSRLRNGALRPRLRFNMVLTHTFSVGW